MEAESIIVCNPIRISAAESNEQVHLIVTAWRKCTFLENAQGI